jgi:hypothetical protein
MHHAIPAPDPSSSSSNERPFRSRRTAEAECLVRLSQEVGYLTEAEAGDLERMLGLTMRSIVGLLRRQLAFRAPA